MLHFSCCSSHYFTKCKVNHNLFSSQRILFLHPNYPIRSNTWPLSCICRWRRLKLFAAFPWRCPGRGKNKPRLLPDLRVQPRQRLLRGCWGVASTPSPPASVQRSPSVPPTSPAHQHTTGLYFKDPQMRTRAMFKFPWNIPTQRSSKSNA